MVTHFTLPLFWPVGPTEKKQKHESVYDDDEQTNRMDGKPCSYTRRFGAQPHRWSHISKKKEVKEKTTKREMNETQSSLLFYIFFLRHHPVLCFIQVCVRVCVCACEVRRVNDLVRRRMVQNLVKFHFQSFTTHSTCKRRQKAFVIQLN